MRPGGDRVEPFSDGVACRQPYRARLARVFSVRTRQQARPAVSSGCTAVRRSYIPASPHVSTATLSPGEHAVNPGIAVLDFGGQYAHLIANRIRRLNVYAETLPPDTPPDRLRRARGIVLSGGPASVYAEDRPPFDPEIASCGLPLLGLCYGHQLLCHHLGGRVEPGDRMEFGAASLRVHSPTGVLRGLAPVESIWMSHRDTVAEMPPGFERLGETEDCPVAAMGDRERRIWGMQFHPEVTHTESGMRILDNFLDLCGCERTWTMENFIGESVASLRERCAGRKLFLFVSGGVDSSVCFLLLNRALGSDRVLGLHIDNGFMRKNETATVAELMRESGFENLKVVDAGREFLAAVAGVSDPEVKRLRIGDEFIRTRDRALEELALDPEEWLLGQGTLYTDRIESGGTDHAETIKTHHNRVPVVEQLLAEGKIVEPLGDLYKDEVRELGEKLGLPRRLVWRHPFPGPGLAVRVLCSDGGANGAAGAQVPGEVAAEAVASGLTADLLPLRSVGVQGDGRSYAHPVRISGPGAAPAAIDWDLLERLSTELTNRLPQVNRVVLQLGPERRLDQRLKEGYLTRERLDLLREADAIAMEALERHGLMAAVTQMPAVLVPLSSDGRGESIVLRPVTTDDFMTARFDRLPEAFLAEVTGKLLDLDGIEAVYYDITHKPPATVEWE